MNIKGIVFALIAAGIGGVASEAAERGLNAADAKLTARRHDSDEEEAKETETETETESPE